MAARAATDMSDHQASDTFLSRVFGLHSVYNQTNDFYRYYDDEEADAYGAPATNLLHSESDLDSLEDTPGRAQAPAAAASVATAASVAAASAAPSALPLPAAPTDINRGAVAFELPLYHRRSPEPTTAASRPRAGGRLKIPPRERALYLWANIVNMDEFLQDVYYYYRGHGYYNIALTRVVDLAILVFVLGFTVFLKYGIDYEMFLNRQGVLTLSDLVRPLALPGVVKFLLTGFAAYIVLRVVQLYFDLRYKLREIHNFYRHLININDESELATISWLTVVERLLLLKDYNGLTTLQDPHYLHDLSLKVRLDALDIANRIMRKENYMIGLVNKNVLNLTLELPLLPVNTLTRTLEWNLQLCINNFVFNQHGQINPAILKEVNRNKLSHELRLRFQMAAIINLLLCPFIVLYFLLLYFFKYFNEYKTNPGSLLGLRQYTPLAEWKLREFNELQHFFMRRLQLSIAPANSYINQFPRGLLVTNVLKLVNFVSGSVLAILVIFGLWLDDEEHNFWSFELSEGKSSLFYISVFGTLWAVTNTHSAPSKSGGSGDTVDTTYYDPEASLRFVSQFTHYLPSAWNGRLHTIEVMHEFCAMYRLKVLIILNELMSLVLTPFILWFNVANSSSLIIDFFRDYLVHVDGLGYVCYFAMFNFEKKDKNMMHDLGKKRKPRREATAANDVELDVLARRRAKARISDTDEDTDEESYPDEKMIKSYMYFLESYGNKPRRQSVKKHSQAVKPSKAGSTRAAAPTASLTESMYNVNYHFDQVEEPQPHKSGVLGMLNQFYKHTDIGR